MIAPDDGPPLHTHAREDEAWYTEPARILVLFTPSGMEGFSDRFAALESFDPAAFHSIGATVGRDVTGPPLRDVGDAGR